MTAKTSTRITKRDMKQDQFVSWVFYLTEQLQKYKGVVLGILGGIVAVIALVWLVANQQSAQKKQVQELFGRATVEMRSGNTDLAIIDFRKILDDHGGSELAGLACYYLAKAYYAQREFNEAETLFRRYLDGYGDDPLLTISSHWGIGGCLEQKGEFAAASDTYLAGVQMDPEGILAGDLLFSAVRTACEAADSVRAMQAYELILEYHADNTRIGDPIRLYLYEHGYLTPPLE